MLGILCDSGILLTRRGCFIGRIAKALFGEFSFQFLAYNSSLYVSLLPTSPPLSHNIREPFGCNRNTVYCQSCFHETPAIHIAFQWKLISCIASQWQQLPVCRQDGIGHRAYQPIAECSGVAPEQWDRMNYSFPFRIAFNRFQPFSFLFLFLYYFCVHFKARPVLIVYKKT